MKRLVRWLLATSFLGIAIIVGGGVADPWLWAYVLSFTAVGAFAVGSMDDELAKERFSPPEPGADKVPLLFVRLVALAHIVVGVLDNRFTWTTLPSPLRAAGLVIFLAAFGLIVHAMRTNRFFSAVVRIQTDRGHHVVDRGPYAVVRHPGYAAMIVAVPASGLALGSWWAVAIGLVYSALVLRRVWFEDRYLRERLQGYADYTRRVPYRLVPGVW
jgi:protein-S-isoprenylcysteine O-methyltransferase Ste14